MYDTSGSEAFVLGQRKKWEEKQAHAMQSKEIKSS